MPRTRAELKAELQAEAERLIEALLNWTEQTEAPDLTAIEDQVLKLRQQFGEKLAEAAVGQQPTAKPLTVRCPQCKPTDASKEETAAAAGGKPGGRGVPKARVLLLRSLPGRAFSPWIGN